MASTGRKQKEMNAGAQLTFFVLSLATRPHKAVAHIISVHLIEVLPQ